MCSVATLARPYQDYSFDYAGHSLGGHAGDQVQVTSGEYGQLMAQSFPQSGHAYLSTPEQTTQAYQQHGIAAVLPSQSMPGDPGYGVDQAHMLSSQVPRRVSHVETQYSSPHDSMNASIAYSHPQSHSSRKRSYDEVAAYDFQGIQQMHAHPANAAVPVPVELTPHGQHAQLQSQAYVYQPQELSPSHSQSGHSLASQAHHHHRLPNQPPPSKLHRTGYGEDAYAAEDLGHPSVVGQPGMPEPAPRPKGPKLKFTPEDDALLVELKEKKNLTWKQIAEFFPGRSSGTLQVRYCTKLKAKTMVWTEEMVDRLRHAMEEYDNDRWRIISGKVGNGFSAAACKDKVTELNGDPVEGVEGGDELDPEVEDFSATE